MTYIYVYVYFIQAVFQLILMYILLQIFFVAKRPLCFATKYCLKFQE